MKIRRSKNVSQIRQILVFCIDPHALDGCFLRLQPDGNNHNSHRQHNSGYNDKGDHDNSDNNSRKHRGTL